MNSKLHLAQSAGGKAMAIRQRQEALDRYYQKPSICHHCHAVIKVEEGHKVNESKDKEFCNRSCYNQHRTNHDNCTHSHRKIGTTISQQIRPCKSCGQKINSKIDICKMCAKIEKLNGKIYDRTKGELFANRNWQNARTCIQKHARRVFWLSGRSKECHVCKYGTHIEVCHIKQVSDFLDTATVKEINHIDNLVGLCPTHHWEFDNGILKINPTNEVAG